VHPSSKYSFVIILSPVGNYYEKGLSPVSIKIEENDVRAVLGGTGGIKCGGNYAGSILAESEAKKEGYDQVLWLDGVHRRFIEEVGTMNVFFASTSQRKIPPGSRIRVGDKKRRGSHSPGGKYPWGRFPLIKEQSTTLVLSL